MKFVGLSDLKSFVGVDAHIDPLLLAFNRERRGGRLRAAVSAVRRATDAAHPLRVLSARCFGIATTIDILRGDRSKEEASPLLGRFNTIF